MREPFEISAAKVSIAIADVQLELAKVWDDTLGRWFGDSKLRRWAFHRREMAYQTLQQWPVSMGGSGREYPDDQA